MAGLLTQWRLEPVDQPAGDRPAGCRAGDGPPAREVWAGLVVYVAEGDGQPLMVQAWEPADRLASGPHPLSGADSLSRVAGRVVSRPGVGDP